MDRRYFLKTVGLGLAATAIPGCANTAEQLVSGKSGKKVNILLIASDDMNYDSPGCFGGKVPDITPNIDRLASQSLRFANAHMDTAVCTPVRSTILSGRYPHRNGALGFYPMNDDVPTLHEVLHKAGFLTGICGKGTINSRGLFYKGPWDFALGGGVDFNYGRKIELFYKHTKDFLERAEKDNKPFFLWVNATDPHRPFATNKHQTPPSRTYKPDEIEVPGFLPDLPKVREELARYFSSVRRCDDAVGETLRALAESDFAEDTIVMFFSDNGMAFPFSKSCCYPFSTKTPWIVKWPGKVKPGSVDNDHFINSIDFMPTVLEATGVPAPDGMDGKSFVPVLLGRKQKGRDSVFTQFDQAGAYPQPDGSRMYMVPIRAAQDKKWIYIFNPWSDGVRVHGSDIYHGLTFPAMQEAAKTDPKIAERIRVAKYRTLEEFYDIENDPHCLNNLISRPEYGIIVDHMRDKLWKYMTDSDDYVLEAFNNRYDKEFVKKFFAKINERGKKAQEKTMRFGYALEHYKSFEDESTTGKFKISLHKPDNFRVEVWTWDSKNLLSKKYTNTKDFVVDISGNPKERYIITLHFDNQVLTRNVTIK